MDSPESAIVGSDGRIYVSEIGEFGKDGDGKVTAIGKSGNAEPFAKGFDDPKGLAASRNALYVADKVRVWKIDMKGEASVFVKADAFPPAPVFLNDLAFDGSGNLYVSDTGDIEKGGKGAIFKVTPAGKDWKNGKLWKLNLKKKGAKPEPYAQAFQASADIGLSRDGKFILVPDMKAGSLAWLPK